jgi:hypothetical protein
LLGSDSELNYASKLQTIHFDLAYKWVAISEYVDIIVTIMRRLRRLKRLSVAMAIGVCNLNRIGGLATKLDAELRMMGIFVLREGGRQGLLDVSGRCGNIMMIGEMLM